MTRLDIPDSPRPVDAFNPTHRASFGATRRGTVDPKQGWFDDNQLGIDQGPILLMIENHRTGLIWKVMHRNPYIVSGLKRAGFTGAWLDEAPQNEGSKSRSEVQTP